jgi:hypothetical protein
VGTADIEKVRNYSLLKLLIYELIVYCDEKSSTPTNKKFVDNHTNNNREEESMTSVQ